MAETLGDLNPVVQALDGARYIPANRSRLQPYTWSELSSLPKRVPLIRGVLDCSGLSLLYGESGCGKTFLALDISLSIVFGVEWCGRKVKKGAVVYIAAEGGGNIGDRLEAYREYHGWLQSDYFAIIPFSVDCSKDSQEIEELITEIQKIPAVSLVVVDTLSRAISGADENSSSAMTGFISSCDKIRERTGAHVLIVHHCGKSSENGPRGHSSLKAAVDTVIAVKNTKGRISAVIEKQRDSASGDEFHFKLESIPLGQDEEGSELASCVLCPTDRTENSPNRLSKQSRAGLKILNTCIQKKIDSGHINDGVSGGLRISLCEYREAFKEADICASDKPNSTDRALKRCMRALKNEGIIDTCEGFVWLADKSDKARQTRDCPSA